jgi:hypothetical protein
MQDSWPSAEHEAERASPLPRVEDLPYVERGYDPERVRAAFDAFYRHLARLDATLQTIEAVEVFRGQADELRKELRALRTAGWTQQPWLPSYATRESARPGVPEAVFRWALEACFVIAVPVAAAVADLRSLWIVVAAAGAFAIVAIAEWAASHERDVLPAPLAAPAPPPAPAAEEPAPPVALPPAEPAAGEATEWTLPPPVAEPQQEELTVVGAAEPEPAAEEPEPEPVASVVEPAAEPPLLEPEEPVAEAAVEPEPPPAPPEEPAAEVFEEPARHGLFRRREAAEPIVGEPEGPVAEAAAEPEPQPEAPEEPAAVEPEEPAAEAAPEPEAAELPIPPALPAVEEPEPPSRRRRFRWRRERAADELGEPEPDDARPRHVRVLPAEAESRVEPLDPWEEELDVEPEAEHEATPRG